MSPFCTDWAASPRGGGELLSSLCLVITQNEAFAHFHWIPFLPAVLTTHLIPLLSQWCNPPTLFKPFVYHSEQPLLCSMSSYQRNSKWATNSLPHVHNGPHPSISHQASLPNRSDETLKIYRLPDMSRDQTQLPSKGRKVSFWVTRSPLSCPTSQGQKTKLTTS